MQLQSGTGNSYWAKVDQFNRLHTTAVNQSEIEYLSEFSGDSYSITTDNYTFNSTNSHPWLYIENRETSYNLFFASIIYSYNGGNTSHNRTLTKRLYRNPPAPTANYTSISAANLNFGSVRETDTFIYSWDGSATDGMTIDLSNSANTLTSTVQAGTLVLSDVEGIVLPFGSSVAFSFEPEEVGNASISIKVFFKPV